MSIKITLLWLGAVGLIAATLTQKVPNKIVNLWILCLVVMFFWVSCTDRIEYQRKATSLDNKVITLGQKMIFNRPMAYTRNLNKHVQDKKTYKLNRKLVPLEKTDMPWFHSYKNGVKELEYVPSTMEFTVEAIYKKVPGVLIRTFSGITQRYVLKDEQSKLSTIWRGHAEPIVMGQGNEFIQEVAFLDDISENNQDCKLTVILFQQQAGARTLESIRADLKKYMSFYNGKLEDHIEGDQVVIITGGVDAMAFVYSSKLELGIKEITNNSCILAKTKGMEEANKAPQPTQ